MATARWIDRPRHLTRLRELLALQPVVGLLGARQVGKTTLARHLSDGWEGPVTRFDLESPADLARLQDPLLALGHLSGLVVLDEIQRRADLFPVLRVLVDSPATEVPPGLPRSPGGELRGGYAALVVGRV